MASLLDWLGGQIEGGFAEINPFDNGANYASVAKRRKQEEQQQRVPSPMQPQRQSQPALGMGDVQSRQQRLTQPKLQIPRVNAANISQNSVVKRTQPGFDPLKVAGDVGGTVAKGVNDFVLKPIGELANTAGTAYASGISTIADELSGGREARNREVIRNQIAAQEAQRRANMPGPMNPELRARQQRMAQGSQNIASSLMQDQQRRLDDIRAKNDPIKVGAAGIGLATTVAAPGMGRLAQYLGSKVAPTVGNFGAKVIGNAAAQAPVGAVLGGASQIAQTGANTRPEDLAFGAGMGAIGGAALGGAAPVVGAAAQRLMNNRGMPSSIASKSFAQPAPSAGAPRQSLLPPQQRSTQTMPQQALPPQSSPILQGTLPTPNVTGKTSLNTKPLIPEIPSNNQSRTSPDILAPLPTFDTKKVGKLDKFARSTRSIIERQGNAGRQLAQGLQDSRDTQEIWLGQLQKQMPTVTELARKGRNALVNKDFENFVDAVEGNAAPKNEKIAQAVAEWKATAPQVRERAVGAGLDVGDLGDNYYPHYIDYDDLFKDKNRYNEAINHLVKTGQAPTQEEAIKLLSYARDTSRNRDFGNLESSRIADLPGYDKTPNSLTSYLTGSTKRVANTETFGAGDEKALKLISQIGKEGGDTEAAKNAFDIAVGARNYNETPEQVSRSIRKYITTTRLGLGALTNISQNVNTGVVTGNFRTLGAMFKQLNPKTREFVADTGVISDALINDLRTQKGTESFSQKVLGKAINKITAPGFGIVEKFNRSVAATAGRDYALRLAQKGDDATLRKLGVKGNIINRTLTEAQQIQAARKIVEKTQFKVDPQDLPGWVDSPAGKLVAQFRTFSYNQGKFISNEVLKPAAKGNVLPLGRLLAVLPLGYALAETRRVIDGRPEEEDQLKKGLNAFSKIGGAGLAFDMYQGLNPINSDYLSGSRRVEMGVGALGGPAAGQGAKLLGAVSEAIQQKNIPKDETKLDGKVAVKNQEGDKYTDLTPLSRLGLSQVPIVGTATANRVLPYKKESDEDNDKSGSKIAEATKAIKDQKEDRAEAFKKSLSKDDYSIAQLNKKEQEKLVADGVITQDKLDGLRNYVKNKKKELGYGTDSEVEISDKISPESRKTLESYKEMSDDEREEAFKKTNDAEYKYLLAKYENNSANGEYSAAENISAKKSIAKAKVGSAYTKDVRELYGIAKGDLADYLATEEEGVDKNKLAEDLYAYDRALYDSGLASSLKYKYGINRSTARGGGKGRGKKNGTGVAEGRSLVNLASSLNKIRVPRTSGSKPPQSGVKLPQMRKNSLKRYNVKKASVSKKKDSKIKTSKA